MKQIKINHKVRRLMLSAFKHQIPSTYGVDMIREQAVVMVNDEVVAIYKKANHDLTAVMEACLNLKFPTYQRTSGLLTETININASPRNAKRTNMCRRKRLRYEQPRVHQLFLDYARKIAKDYRYHFREQYAGQVKLNYAQQKVHRTYRIKGTPFTSAVINKNSALGFHRDRANTKDGISCMLCLKQGVAGGELILPELGVGFECQNGYILLFDGQKYIHGVTPIIQPQTGIGYRYTVVYYNNKGMALCLPASKETEFFRQYLDQQTESNYQKLINNER